MIYMTSNVECWKLLLRFSMSSETGITVFIRYDLFPGIKEANTYNINYNPDQDIIVKLLK